jgi:hypothetical protein
MIERLILMWLIALMIFVGLLVLWVSGRRG